ncbi:CheR family methyltransferase [Intestinimonas aquisgranensis]
MDPIQFRLKFDVIFCRNVMIYFNQEHERDGCLFFPVRSRP